MYIRMFGCESMERSGYGLCFVESEYIFVVLCLYVWKK